MEGARGARRDAKNNARADRLPWSVGVRCIVALSALLWVGIVGAVELSLHLF